MTTIDFKSMKLSEDERTVIIKGNCLGHNVKIEVSIIQLAKIFGTDREIADEATLNPEECEKKCKETKEYAKKFPDIAVWDKELEFREVSVEDESWTEISADPKIIMIYAEDICGWDNEGIRIDFPIKVYNSELKGKNFGVYVSPFYADLKEDDKMRMTVTLPTIGGVVAE
jgi:hypothetical protein